MQGFLCATALGLAAPASAQVPAPAPQPAAAAAPAPVLAPPPMVQPAARPLPPTVEEREDPFQPPPTEAERRAEEERRLRDLVRPLIDQMRDQINQGVSSQIQDGVRGAVEEYGRKNPPPEAQPKQVAMPVAPPPKGAKARKPSPAGGGVVDPYEDEDDKAEREEARLQAAIEKATAMLSDPDPVVREIGRGKLELIKRGRMPKWSSGEIYFAGCVNKRKLYRDKFGNIFESELWYAGGTAAGGTSGGSYASAARPGPGQQSASAGSAAIGASAGGAVVDPCAD